MMNATAVIIPLDPSVVIGDIRREVGEAIYKARKAKGYTHRQLGDRIGVAQSLVDDWETGVSLPNGGQFKRLRGALGKVLMSKRFFELREVANGIPQSAVANRGLLLNAIRSIAEFDATDGAQSRPLTAPIAAFAKVQAPPPPPESKPVAVEPPPSAPAKTFATFGEALRAAREAEGLGQNDLAKLVGVSGHAVSQWETNQNAPVQENHKKLVDLLGPLAPAPSCQDIPKPIGPTGCTFPDRNPKPRMAPPPEAAPRAKRITKPEAPPETERAAEQTPAPVPHPADPPRPLTGLEQLNRLIVRVDRILPGCSALLVRFEENGTVTLIRRGLDKEIHPSPPLAHREWNGRDLTEAVELGLAAYAEVLRERKEKAAADLARIQAQLDEARDNLTALDVVLP